MWFRRGVSLILCIGCSIGPMHAQAADAGGDGPDAAAYGQALGYPVAPRGQANVQRFMVGSYSHFDAIYPARAIAKPPVPRPLHPSLTPLSFAYAFRDQSHTLDDYLSRNPATGLLIARGDTILFERYQFGRTAADRMTSQSMAKTVVAMLVGVAIEEHAIRSVDDPADACVRELAGTELGRTPIRALLHMASGIAFTETYDSHDDDALLSHLLFSPAGPGPASAVARFSTRTAPPDTVWHYAGLNTEVLGLVLARATGQSLASYLQSRIWQPMEAEADASWTTDGTGQEVAYCCLNAVLRDYARFGLLLASGGALGGRQIIPRQWLVDATTAPAPNAAVAPGPNGQTWGYGYQTWLMPGPRHDVALMGVHGQRVFIDPPSGLVLVQTAVRVSPTRSEGDVELNALWRGLLEQLGPIRSQPGR